jgi:hypothetical protein
LRQDHRIRGWSKAGQIIACLTLLLGILFIGGCGETVREVAVRRVSEYRHVVHQSGLSASVDPFVDEERLVNHFGADLLADGLLPIFVVLENHGYGDGVVVLKERIALELGSAAIAEASERYKYEADVNVSTTKSVGGAAVAASGAATVAMLPIMAGTPVVSIAFLPVTIAVSMQAAKTERVARRVEDRAIQFRTVYPGQVQSGFIYFKLGVRENAAHLVALTLPVQNINTREVMPLRFALDAQP